MSCVPSRMPTHFLAPMDEEHKSGRDSLDEAKGNDPAKKWRSPRRIIVVGTCLVGFAEWLLLELIRIPYSPPYDMSTFLGQEKYDVLALMGIMLAAWTAIVLYLAVTSRFTLRDYLAFTALLAALFSVLGILVRYPQWPVTPPDMLW
jgi:hypothetical protein